MSFAQREVANSDASRRAWSMEQEAKNMIGEWDAAILRVICDQEL